MALLGGSCALAGATLLTATAAAAGDAQPTAARRYVDTCWLPLLAARDAAAGAQAARVDAAAAAAVVHAAAWATVAQLLLSAADGLPACAASWQPQPLPGGEALAALAAGCEDAQPPPLPLGGACAAAAALLEAVQRRAASGDAAAAAAASAAGCALLPRALGALGDTAVADAAVLRALLPLAHAAAALQQPAAADEALRCAACALLAPAASPEASRRAGLALLVRMAAAAPVLDSAAADDVALWAAVRRAMFGPEALQRKQALHAVRGALGPSAAGGAAWAELLSLFHGLEDFNMQCVPSCAPHLHRVLQPARAHTCVTHSHSAPAAASSRRRLHACACCTRQPAAARRRRRRMCRSSGCRPPGAAHACTTTRRCAAQP